MQSPASRDSSLIRTEVATFIGNRVVLLVHANVETLDIGVRKLGFPICAKINTLTPKEIDPVVHRLGTDLGKIHNAPQRRLVQ